MSQNSIMERGLGLRMLIALALVLAVGAAAFVVTQPANALGTAIVVTGEDYDGDVDSSLVDLDDPTDIGTVQSWNGANTETGAAIDTAAGVDVLYRTPATGGAVDISAKFTGDAVAGGDIVDISTTLGGINAIAGPTSITQLSNLHWAAQDGAGLTLFGQAVAGTATVSITSGVQVGVTAGAGAAQVIFVGGPVAGAFGATTVALAGALNPLAFGAGTAAALATQYWFVNVKDGNNQNVLDGNAATITLVDLTAAATLATFGSVAAGGLTSAVVVTEDEAAIVGGSVADHGGIVFGLTTTAGVGVSGTIRVTYPGITPLVIERAFVASGAATTVVLTAPVAPILSLPAVATNPIGIWTAAITDAGGNAVSGALAQLAVTAVATELTVGATLALVEAPAASGLYTVSVTGVATVAAGTYTLTATLTSGVTTLDTSTNEVIIGGAATGGSVVSVLDAAGVDMTETPIVGIGEAAVITVAFTDANGNPPPNGTAVAVASPLGGVPAAGSVTSTAGNSSATFTPSQFTGITTVTFTSGTGIVQLTINVGGTAGDNPDAIVADGDTAIDASVGSPVALSVIVSRAGATADGAIVQFESTGGSLAPAQVTTGADGVATTNFQSAVDGTFNVTATVMASGVTDLVPVSGLTLVFTVDVGGSTVVLATGETATFLAWTGPETTSSQAFADAANLTIVWRWNSSTLAWEGYAVGSDLPAALQTSFELSNGDVLYIVTTGAVTLSV